MLKFVDYDIVFQEVPDEVSLAINLSCCPNSCPGCHSPQLQGDIGEILDKNIIGELIEKYGSSITCVAFMGGDNDPQSIESLANYVKKKFSLKTAWYSGCVNIPQCRTSFDYIKIGPYVESLGALRSKTTNQRFYKVLCSSCLEDITSFFQKK